jgi:hypothetical protein
MNPHYTKVKKAQSGGDSIGREKRGWLMGIVLPCKHLLIIGCCLFLVSGLSAEAPVSQPKGSGKDQTPRVDKAPPPVLTREQLDQLFTQLRFEQPRSKLEAQRNCEAAVEWMHWLLYALLALGGLGGGWGAKQVLTRKLPPPRLRVDQLGLGADGKGGVWLREVPPWE